MMQIIWNIVQRFPGYLWSGWGALASIFLFLACWDWGHLYYGSLVLPSPMETFSTLYQLLQEDFVWQNINITLSRAISGFFLAVLLGSLLGFLAGLYVIPAMMARPIVTILMGMPPIAWIVLAMIWFGMSNQTVVFTVVIASFPLVFVGALQGTRTLDNELAELAQSFRLPFRMKLTDIYFPHLFSYLFPSWITALGMSWKIVVMAELLAVNDGIGALLATARSQLDTAQALALVVIMIASLLCLEYLLMEPVKNEVEQWRN